MALGLRQIRYFIAIADAGVLSRAAEMLNVAQSALSHHVAALETDLGVELLERRPRGIALTAAGRRLYEHASAVLSALGKAEEDVRTYNELRRPVCVGFSHTAISMVALDVMKAVRVAGRISDGRRGAVAGADRARLLRDSRSRRRL